VLSLSAPMSRRPRRIASYAVLLLFVCSCDSTPTEPATGHSAQRIITLSPHLAELVFTAGAGDRLVGVVEYSDFPPRVASLPRVGDAFRIDYEAIADLSPDLILAWRSGNPIDVQNRLRQLGYNVESLEPVHLDDVADHLRRIGQLAGTRAVADRAADAFAHRLEVLRRDHASVAPVRVFYQISREPLRTASNRHVIGQAIQLCGGHNVFGELPELVPAIALESVLDKRPEVLLAGTANQIINRREWMAAWQSWGSLPAVKAGNLFLVDADLLSRASTRLIQGITEICEALNDSRTNLSAIKGQTQS
jgi:iron complex transport system substrate-binding protein